MFRQKPKKIVTFLEGTVRLSVGGFSLCRWALERPAFQPLLINRDRDLDGTIKAALQAAENGTHFSYPDLGVGICVYVVMAELSGYPFKPALNTVEDYFRHLRVHSIVQYNHKLVPLFLSLVFHYYYSDNPPQKLDGKIRSINLFPKVENWLTTRLLLELG